MPEAVLTDLLLVILSLLGLAHVLGALAVRLRQPKVIGEILAGVLLGPEVFGRSWSTLGGRGFASITPDAVNFVYWLGLLLLMFLSGRKPENRLHVQPNPIDHCAKAQWTNDDGARTGDRHESPFRL